MIIKVSVVLNSSSAEVENLDDNNYVVHLTENPENNKANIQLIKVLSKYFNTHHSNIRIKSGLRNKRKVVEVSL